jgi:hypothetical protein
MPFLKTKTAISSHTQTLLMDNRNRVRPFEPRLRRVLNLAVFLAALAPAALLTAAEGTAAQTPKTEKPAEKSSAPNPSKEKPKVVLINLSGAELYSMHCNRCHPERYPTERTAAQWRTIMLHMRVRANLPAEQARTILKYLQDNSGR